ncbi:MAG: CoxG family protein [Limnohabitans sp.]
MELKGEQRIPMTRERVWAGLMDPHILKAAIPGCESVTDEGEGRMSVVVVAAIGPVKARFKGQLQMLDLQAPERYTLSFEGHGGMAGFATGQAEVVLHAEAEGTRMVYQAQADIGGRLAQIGSRLVDAAAAHMSAQFFERLVEVMQAPAAAPAAAVPAAVPAAVVPAGVAAPAPVAPAPARAAEPSMVTLQMPAWTWAFTIAVVALTVAYVATH